MPIIEYVDMTSTFTSSQPCAKTRFNDCYRKTFTETANSNKVHALAYSEYSIRSLNTVGN